MDNLNIFDKATDEQMKNSDKIAREFMDKYLEFSGSKEIIPPISIISMYREVRCLMTVLCDIETISVIDNTMNESYKKFKKERKDTNQTEM